MRNHQAREKLMKQVVSMTEEKVTEMLAWIRSRGILRARRARKTQTSQQELKGNLASMSNQEVQEMVAATRQKHPRYLASLIRLPTLALVAIAKMVGWPHTEKQSR